MSRVPPCDASDARRRNAGAFHLAGSHKLLPGRKRLVDGLEGLALDELAVALSGLDGGFLDGNFATGQRVARQAGDFLAFEDIVVDG